MEERSKLCGIEPLVLEGNGSATSATDLGGLLAVDGPQRVVGKEDFGWIKHDQVIDIDPEQELVMLCAVVENAQVSRGLDEAGAALGAGKREPVVEKKALRSASVTRLSIRLIRSRPQPQPVSQRPSCGQLRSAQNHRRWVTDCHRRRTRASWQSHAS